MDTEQTKTNTITRVLQIATPLAHAQLTFLFAVITPPLSMVMPLVALHTAPHTVGPIGADSRGSEP